MNRFQKKCLIASLSMHGLLLLVMVVGTAFFTSKKDPVVESAHIIELVPNAIVTDGKTGGGNPAPAPMATAAAAAVKPPEIIPPKPVPADTKPEAAKEVVEPKPKEIEPKETVSELPSHKKKKTPPKPVETKETAKPKRQFDISKPVVRDNKDKDKDKAAAEKAQRVADQHVRAERMAAFNGIRKNIENNLSSGTTIEMPSGTGGSGGGQAEINYGDFVLSKYDAAWIAPTDVDDNQSIVKARVVIARNGNVISSEIIKGSRNQILDKSVRRALDSVSFIQRFPEGSSDSQRTYIINFNLKSKRAIG
ncbi:MAG: TonB C-terminal domain-containing protein [Verrucomicrobiota bacterium]